jgi:prolyl-tRNA synthetase
MVGGLIMAQGDDNGLRLPPRIAPIQAVVIVVRDDADATAIARRLADGLTSAGIRVQLDADVSSSYGRRVTDWELKGVPLRIEVGPRELVAGNVTLVRRDNGSKTPIALSSLGAAVAQALQDAQTDLLATAMQDRDARTSEVTTLDAAVEAAQEGFARVPWQALGERGEDELARHGVTVRCIQREDGAVPAAEDEPNLVAVVAKAY